MEIDFKIEKAIKEIEQEIQKPNAPIFLSYIRQWLEEIAHEIKKPVSDPQRLLGLASGLGRGVTEDYEFSEGQLGTRLLEIASEIIRKYDQRFRNRAI